jgi:hypothetical protein
METKTQPEPTPKQPNVIQLAPGVHKVSTAVVNSLVLTGWGGALINHQKAKGLLFWLLGGALISVLTGGMGFFIVYPLGILDTYLIAQRLHRGEAVGQWKFF